MWDLESTGLEGDVGRILCGSILDVTSGQMTSFRRDKLPGKNKADDSRLAKVIRDELEKYHLTIGWYCLSPNTPILTADLRWRAAGDLNKGDAIAGFDSKPAPNRRHWQNNFVEENSLRKVECAWVHFDDGPSILASMEHPWLCIRKGKSTKWVRTKHLLTYAKNHGVGLSRPKYITEPWKQETSFDAGWLAGFLDGEGHLAQDKSLQLALTQQASPEMDRAAAILTKLGFKYSIRAYDAQQPHMRQLLLNGGKTAVLQLLGRVRPERLIRNLRWDDIGTIQHNEDTQHFSIAAVEPAGLQEVAAMATHTSTYVGDGFFHHNSKGFDVAFLNTRLVKAGLKPLRSHLHLDPIWYCKGWRGLKPRSAKMAVMSEFFNLPERKPGVDVDIWIDAAQGGDKAAMDELVERCEADVRITYALTLKLLDTGMIKSINSYP